MEDWALIRRLVAEGVPQRQVARDLGIGRERVRRALAAEGPPKYERAPAPTAFDVFEPRVRAILEDHPGMPASVIAERVGWTGSMTWFRDNVRRLRPLYRRPDPADRLTWEAGDVAQCDLWFPPKKIPLENGTSALLPVLVITAAYSRFVLGRMIPSKTTEDLLLGMWQLLQLLGRVPRRLMWDNEKGIGRGPHRSQGVPAFMGTLATRLVLLPPRDPESKGVVERRNGWFETSFMPGRDFDSPADFNHQFADWLATANQRVVRTTQAKPVDRLEKDRAAMLALPPVPPVVGWRKQVRLGRDYYVRIASNDYSVDPTWIGRMVDTHADLERVQVRLEGRLVTEHPRVWARGLTVTDTAHVDTAKRLRQEFQHPRTQAVADGLVRDLADYDKAFGLTGEGGL
ncbi:MAG: IS21 family transposase [Propionicimonas sp.]